MPPKPKLMTRPPSNRPPWPLVVLDGQEKAGKTYSGVQLASDPRVGQMFGFDLGEGSLDEYGPLSRPAGGGPGSEKLLIVEWGGTYRGLADQMEAAMAAPRLAPELPNAILLDTGTDLWWSLARWIEKRARWRDSNQAKLREDPDAELDIGRDLWNDAAERWRDIVEPLRTWDGIAIITVRGGWVSDTNERGQVKQGPKVWSTNAHKSLPFDASVHVRMEQEGRKATVVATRSLELHVPAGGLALPADWSVAHVVFDLLRLDPAQTSGRVLTKMTEQIPVPQAKKRLVEAYKRAGLEDTPARDAARVLWAARELPNGSAEEIDMNVLVGLVEEAGSAPTPVPGRLEHEPPSSGSTEPTGALSEPSAPPEDGATPDAPEDESGEVPPPGPVHSEEERIEAIRGWVASIEREALPVILGDLDLDRSGAHPTQRKRLRDHLTETGWAPPEEAFTVTPTAPAHEPSLRERWSLYLAAQPEAVTSFWGDVKAIPNPHTGPGLAALITCLVESGTAVPLTPDEEGALDDVEEDAMDEVLDAALGETAHLGSD